MSQEVLKIFLVRLKEHLNSCSINFEFNKKDFKDAQDIIA